LNGAVRFAYRTYGPPCAGAIARFALLCGQRFFTIRETTMAERNRTRRNTLERRCLPKSFKRLFVGSSRTMFRLLEKVKKA